MSLCSYVLLFTALAAAEPRYGVSPYVSYSLGTQFPDSDYVSYVAYVLMLPR